jgi:hypothetical protein
MQSNNKCKEILTNDDFPFNLLQNAKRMHGKFLPMTIFPSIFSAESKITTNAKKVLTNDVFPFNLLQNAKEQKMQGNSHR